MNMKKIVLLGISTMSVATAAHAQYDSLKIEQMQEVVVNGVRAQKNAPYAITNIRKTELQSFARTGKELPMLFSQTPGVIAWSDNGVGTGTSYMRIRGAGDSRINVTLDGMPLNSPEDQCVFWANMNSYGAMLGSVQIQRGVGTSTNGDGAFGGTVALSTAAPSPTPTVEVSGSYGSYNTWNAGVSLSSGLLFKHLIIDGAYHETNTDGFIHGTAGRSGSYYGGLTWMNDRIQIRYKNIGNFEKTGQAWSGITAGDDDLSLMDGTYGANTGIKTYKDMYEVGLGRFNSLYERLVYDESGNFAKDANGKYITKRYEMNDGSLWSRTTDNFWQDHNILSFAWDINNYWSTTASARYTYGYGYYDQFRYNYKLAKFGLKYTDADGNAVKRSDFVRKKGLEQNTYGLVWNTSYKRNRWDIVGGVAMQYFSGNHFGYITYIANKDVAAEYLKNGRYDYYDSDAKKMDGSAFAKAAFSITDNWNVFADIQYRHVGYKTDGINDKFYDNESGFYNQKLDIDKKYDFFNPKAGFSWTLGEHRVYGSAALSHREPERNNFTDNGSYPAPKAESLIDYELGYTLGCKKYRFGINLYYMDYTDQFVQTGQENEIGEKLTTNIKDSYRAGIELQCGADFTPWLSLDLNMAVSQNKIKDFDEVVEDWDSKAKFRTIHYDNSTLAFSPAFTGNAFLSFHHKGMTAVWHTSAVGRQYLDNTANKDRSLPAFSVSNIHLGYTMPIKPLHIKEAAFGIDFNNVFNARYATSGWVYSAICESYGHPNDNRYYELGFVPMAGFTMMGNITLKF